MAEAAKRNGEKSKISGEKKGERPSTNREDILDELKYVGQNSNKNGKNKKKEFKGNTIVNIILGISLSVIILAGFCAFIYFDVGGFGSGVFAPVAKNWPIIKNILPETIEEEKEYPYDNMAEAVETIQELQKKIDKLQKENDDISIEVDELEKENKKLKEFESQQVEFEKLKAEFEEEIVFGEDAIDTSEYLKFYESIEPEKAEELYKQVISEENASEEIADLASTYAKMDPGAAASALEALGDDVTMVCDILTIMSQKNRAAIMDEMSAEFVAKVTQKIYSDNE